MLAGNPPTCFILRGKSEIFLRWVYWWAVALAKCHSPSADPSPLDRMKPSSSTGI
jgi:hypothetical protein